MDGHYLKIHHSFYQNTHLLKSMKKHTRLLCMKPLGKKKKINETLLHMGI